MKDMLKKVRADLIISSILCIVFGVVLIVKPIETVSLFCRILAIVMIVVGALFLCSYFFHMISNGLSAAMGGIILLIGVWILISPEVIETLIPIVIGVIMLFHGIQGFRMSWESKGYGSESWKIEMLLSVISIIFGTICIADAFKVVQVTMIIIGIALIYNGLSNIWITIKTTKAAKKHTVLAEPVDVEFKD